MINFPRYCLAMSTTTVSRYEFDQAAPTPSGQARKGEVGTSIELFTGGGGLAQAMHNVGFRHLLCNEYAPRACETLRANTAVAWSDDMDPPTHVDDPWPLIEGNIRELFDGGRFEKSVFAPFEGKVDVVAGGPPCQPFSLGGVHKGDEDERNMFPQLFRVVRETRPRAIICENVRGLLRRSFKPYFDYIVRELTAPFEQRDESEKWYEHDARLRGLSEDPTDPAERYDVHVIPVNAADFGVPQVRHRVIIVAFRKDLDVQWRSPLPSHSEALLRRTQRSGEYWERHGITPTLDQDESSDIVDAREDDGSANLPWRTLRDAIHDLPEPVLGQESKGYRHHVGWPGARIYKGHTPNHPDRPAKTVKAGVHGVPGGETVMYDLNDLNRHRYMTVREVARVMTFPDSWRLVGPRGEQMRQLGNAVPVDLGQVFADAVSKALRPHLEST
jgi:DNA (cytosine-5)-methyltransferase 1